ncbi:DUF6460 domain-containing protein [Parvularcula lutaonensis]|uniref:DUF6460 domain-containing protein n=1 Tax=Parvularcula lutaonensis TaxID=491923 RepID=A0ABV7MDZ7_9PROT|nr:DUF6460 domain-containing protein [Parvularcula lutaonensis]GGY54285.1 hypothetical protein GCM10007148_24810 [Parvularcula lutaonensis]
MSDQNPLRDRILSPTVNGGAILRTVIRLAVACLVVGALLAILRLNPIRMWQQLYEWMQTGLIDLFGTGLEGLSLVGTLIATGAVIVLPIWLIGKLLSLRKR